MVMEYSARSSVRRLSFRDAPRRLNHAAVSDPRWCVPVWSRGESGDLMRGAQEGIVAQIRTSCLVYGGEVNAPIGLSDVCSLVPIGVFCQCPGEATARS